MVERNSKEYKLAERIVFLQSALNTANERFKERGEFGVGPDNSISFRKAASHHAKVRRVLKEVV